MLMMLQVIQGEADKVASVLLRMHGGSNLYWGKSFGIYMCRLRHFIIDCIADIK